MTDIKPQYTVREGSSPATRAAIEMANAVVAQGKMSFLRAVTEKAAGVEPPEPRRSDLPALLQSLPSGQATPTP